MKFYAKGSNHSCLKACKMIDKGCLYCVVRVKDLECETPIKSVPVVREYLDVFPDDLPGVPPEQELSWALTYYQI